MRALQRVYTVCMLLCATPMCVDAAQLVFRGRNTHFTPFQRAVVNKGLFLQQVCMSPSRNEFVSLQVSHRLDQMCTIHPCCTLYNRMTRSIISAGALLLSEQTKERAGKGEGDGLNMSPGINDTQLFLASENREARRRSDAASFSTASRAQTELFETPLLHVTPPLVNRLCALSPRRACSAFPTVRRRTHILLFRTLDSLHLYSHTCPSHVQQPNMPVILCDEAPMSRTQLCIR